MFDSGSSTGEIMGHSKVLYPFQPVLSLDQVTLRTITSHRWADASCRTSAALQASRHASEVAYRSEDAREGPQAFAEKRRPKWTGR